MTRRVVLIMVLLACCIRCEAITPQCDSEYVRNMTNVMSYVDKDQGLIFLIGNTGRYVMGTNENAEDVDQLAEFQDEYGALHEWNGNAEYGGYLDDYQFGDIAYSDDDEYHEFDSDDADYETADEEFDEDESFCDATDDEFEYDDFYELNDCVEVEGDMEDVDSMPTIEPSFENRCYRITRTNSMPYIDKF